MTLLSRNAIDGTYYKPKVPQHSQILYRHTFVRLPDGSIVDVTANQFGDADPIRVIGPNDPRQLFYFENTLDDCTCGYPLAEFPFWREQYSFSRR